MYSDDYQEEETKKSGSGLKDFYNNNKKLIWILGIVIIIVLIALLMPKGGSNTPELPEEKPELVLVEEKEGLRVGLGKSKQLDVTVKNVEKANIIYESSDTSIAEVNSMGLVTGKSLGKVTIKATYVHTDGTPYSKTCEVTVFEGNVDSKITSVMYPEGDLLMSVGSNFDLSDKLIITPDDGYIESKEFTSSNPSIVEIDEEGKVKAKSVGEAEITAVVNESFKSTIKVYVLNEYIISEIVKSATNINFASELLKVKVGEIKKIEYTLTPSNANTRNLKWTSSNEKVVAVTQEGEISALKVGTSMITLSQSNGISASMIVEVEEDIVKVESVTYDEKTITINVGDTYTIEPTVTPENASNKGLSFTSSDKSIAKVSTTEGGISAKITGEKVGTAKITIKSLDDENISIKITVNVQKQGGGGGGGSTGCPTSCKAGNYLSGCGCYSCEAGYYCNGSKKTACPANYSSAPGSTYITNCYTIVGAGYYATWVGSHHIIAKCPGATTTRNAYYGSSIGCPVAGGGGSSHHTELLN